MIQLKSIFGIQLVNSKVGQEKNHLVPTYFQKVQPVPIPLLHNPHQNYQEYNAVSFLDDFEEDYEEGEWERAVLSENMWGLNDFSPDQLLNLQVEFQRCFSAGSYNLLDKTLRLPIKSGQKKLNFYEQRVIVHELVHSLQGQHFEISEWYQEMDELDDFSNYPGVRALMEAQADWVEAKWVDSLDSYDRQTMQAQIPNISCRVELPAYFYIPSDLYYTYGPILAREIINQGKMAALNEALSLSLIHI